ncbi:MAG: sigma-70 family RNA polymerase sigma factor [Saprospiraceae bacterium]|nr:sigma-70 family RNA polymerase sigma factor [Saprospiraceae bacterium]
MTQEELAIHLAGCQKHSRISQKVLYLGYYDFALSICSRYITSNEIIEEVINDAFYKVFTKIEQYNESWSFKTWFHRIVINTAIDRIRLEKKLPQFQNLDATNESVVWVEEEYLENLTQSKLLLMLDQLSPAYKTVFTLFVLDELSHEEISKMLNISIGTSKSNLFRARKVMRVLMESEQL